MIFKYAEFRKFLLHIKSLGEVIPLGELGSSNAIILRHDVDFDVDAAYRLALLELECGVRSTFFFLTTSHAYNPFSEYNRKKISEMAELGFEIGLHFDPTIYGNVSDIKLIEYVKKEAEMLSLIAGYPVKSVSLHNPSVHGQYPLFEGFNNAYDKEIFSEGAYISDSRMDFRGKDPYKFIENVKEKTIQILLHPLHYSENGLGYLDFLYGYIKNHTDLIDHSLQVNSTYISEIKEQTLFSFIINKGKDEIS